MLSQSGVASYFHYDAPLLREAGCYPQEEGFSWTDGDRMLPARFFATRRGAWTLEVHTRRNGMRYPLPSAVAEAA